ncbi:MAG: AMP-binding protein [Candidatus Lokiarchaeota archaeon]|nr:AMP-binding protein [Candidatus Lokiarchaeota archaeon]
MEITTNIPEDRPWFHCPFWPKGMPFQLTYDASKTMYDFLEEAATEVPDWPALFFTVGEGWISYGELKEYVDRFANGLLQLGVKKGDVISIILGNSPQYVISYYAAQKIGAIPTGVNPTYKPAEVLHQLEITKSEYIIVLDALYESMIKPIADKLDLIKGFISTNIADLATGLSGFKIFLGKLLGKIPKGKVPAAHNFTDLLKASPNSPRAEIDQANDTATLIMTGGTTGVPKAAVLTHRNVYCNALQCQYWLLKQKDPDAPADAEQLGPKSGMVGILPLFHSFAHTVVMNIAIASKAWMMLFPRPPLTEEILEAFNKINAPNGLIYAGAEVLFQRIADLENLEPYREGLAKLKLCVSGAGPLHKPVQDKFEERTGARITEGYGLTESTPVVSAGNFYGEQRSVGTIGMPFPGTDWKIFPSDNFDEGPIDGIGEENTGEICVSGPQVMKGYLDRPEQTAETIKEWGGKMWLLTGDIGFMDEFGRCIIRDRKKQLIKMKGYSVYPKEVESLVGHHPDVLEVAAAGIPDPETGEMVKAWVKVKDGSDLTPESLRAWCKENMTHYKVPGEIEFRDEIPKSMVGKVMRRTLQEEDPRYQAAMKK